MKVSNCIGKSKAGSPIFDYEAGFFVKEVGQKSVVVKDKESLKTYLFEDIDNVFDAFSLIRNNEAVENQLPGDDLDLYED